MLTPSGTSWPAISSAISRSSSTISTRRPRIAASVAPSSSTTAGSSTVNVVPRSGSDSTSIRPSCSSTSDLTIDSPSPVPGVEAPLGAAVEPLEDPLGLLRRHADAGVLDDELHPRAVGLDGDVDRAALARVQVGVGDQVRDDLPAPAPGRRARGRRPARRGRTAAGACPRSGARSAPPPRGPPRRGRSDGATISTRSASIRATSRRSLTSSVKPVGRLEDDLDELALALAHALGRAVEQLDEALDRRQRAAQLVRGGRGELALGPLEPRSLGRVADRPHERRRLVGEHRGGHGQRAALVLDDRLARRARRRAAGSGLSGESTRSPTVERRHEPRGARVDRGDRRRPGLGHDQRVAEALDRDLQPAALLLGSAAGR